MRLSSRRLPGRDFDWVMKTLLAQESPPNLPEAVVPLYNLKPMERDAIVAAMPWFDRWDFLKPGEVSR